MREEVQYVGRYKTGYLKINCEGLVKSDVEGNYFTVILLEYKKICILYENVQYTAVCMEWFVFCGRRQMKISVFGKLMFMQCLAFSCGKLLNLSVCRSPVVEVEGASRPAQMMGCRPARRAELFQRQPYQQASLTVIVISSRLLVGE